jgi:RimJ/RimL family protein N-acetyltransferase
MQKLTLRPINQEDAQFLHELTTNKDFQEYYLERLVFKTLTDAKREVEKIIKETKNNKVNYFILEMGKTRIGFLDLYKATKKDKRVSIGYGIKPEFSGKGIGTKLCKMGVIKAKELGFHTIEATADPKNKASQKVLENNGFTKIGIAKDYYLDRGKYIDRVIYWKVL